MENKTQFTQGKIYIPLLKFALPVLFALFLQSMYGAVDLAVVGWFGDTADVSAVATGSQMMLTVTMFASGIALGTTVLLGRRLGENRPDRAGEVIGGAICLFFALALILTALMEGVAMPFAKLMHAPETALQKTVNYVRICSGGMIFIVAYNTLGSVFRGIGDSKTPLMSVGISCVLNIAGDLFFVAVLDMAAAGAALATVISQGCSVLICVLIIRKRGLPFPFSRKDIRFNKSVISQTVAIGFPIALQDVLVAVSFLAIVSIVNSLGEVASAGVGVAEKLCAFIMLIPGCFSQSLSAFTAQNFGAKKLDRARKAMLYSMLTSLGCGIVLAYLSFFHGDMLAGLFANGKPEVIAAAWDYLKAYAIDTLLVSFYFCFNGYFNGCGRTRFVMIQGIIGAFAVRIPVSFLMSRLEPVSLFRVGLATPCSTLVQTALCIVYYAMMRKKGDAEYQLTEK